jgi:TPP-dependent indolepyruvate ferredoxin oxidoreductase alpha subunit
VDPLQPTAPGPRILPRCRAPRPSREGPGQPRGAVLGPPLAIAPERCNRCGACLRLGCGAIADLGGDALVIDPALCSGCGACAPVCRARAPAPVPVDAGALVP